MGGFPPITLINDCSQSIGARLLSVRLPSDINPIPFTEEIVYLQSCGLQSGNRCYRLARRRLITIKYYYYYLFIMYHYHYHQYYSIMHWSSHHHAFTSWLPSLSPVSSHGLHILTCISLFLPFGIINSRGSYLAELCRTKGPNTNASLSGKDILSSFIFIHHFNVLVKYNVCGFIAYSMSPLSGSWYSTKLLRGSKTVQTTNSQAQICACAQLGSRHYTSSKDRPTEQTTWQSSFSSHVNWRELGPEKKTECT